MRKVAKVFNVSYNSVRRCIAKNQEGLSLEPGVPPGSPPKLREQALEWLRAEIESNPYVTTYELTAKFNKAHRSNQVHRSTIQRAVRKLGYTYKKRLRSRLSAREKMSELHGKPSNRNRPLWLPMT